MPQDVKLGKYGTSMFRGTERFSTKHRSNTSQVESMGPLDWGKATSKGKGWVNSSTPRFGRTVSSETANVDIYVPPGIAEKSQSARRGGGGQTSAWARMSADRFGENYSVPGSQRRARSAEPTANGPAATYVPPGFADEILKSKRGSSYFRGTERLSRVVKSETANCDMYTPAGLAEEMARSKVNPMKASCRSRFQERKDQKETGPGRDSMYVPKSVGDVPKKPGTKAAFGGTGDRFPDKKADLTAQATHVDPSYGTIGSNAEKVKGKGTWSKHTGARLQYGNASQTSPNADQYVPKPFGSDVTMVPRFGKTSSRFSNEEKKANPAPYYDPPSFVDMILRK